MSFISLPTKVSTLLAAALCLATVSSAAQTPLFDDKPLFSDPLFSDDDITTKLDNDTKRAAQATAVRQRARAAVGQQINDSEVDQNMRQQIRKVAHYLQVYGVRNSSRFPGLTNDEGYAVQVQLEELCPNNPYAYGPTETTFAAHGMPAWYNDNGSPKTGSPVWGDDWTSHLQAQTNNRVQLSMDYGLTPQLIDYYAQNPPDTWNGAPGTICAAGNNQGLFIVWGYGADGKPLRNPMNGNAFVVSGSTSGTVNDQAAPNEDQ